MSTLILMRKRIFVEILNFLYYNQLKCLNDVFGGYIMSLYQKIVNGDEKISLVGLGYVGMPIAVSFAKKVKVIGFDLNAKKLNFIN